MSKKISISQNFLTNRKLIERIINLSSIQKQDTVVEIGTGKGHLTQILCKKCGFLYSNTDYMAKKASLLKDRSTQP